MFVKGHGPADPVSARGIDVEELVDGVHQSSLEELAEWTRWADKIIVFQAT